MNTLNPDGHYWSYCDYCETTMVMCGRCGNNCCNAMHGEEIGPEPGSTIECRACPSAYEKQNLEGEAEWKKYLADPEAYLESAQKASVSTGSVQKP